MLRGSGDARFTIQSDAGTVRFTGYFHDGRGTGDYVFVPSPPFAAELER